MRKRRICQNGSTFARAGETTSVRRRRWKKGLNRQQHITAPAQVRPQMTKLAALAV
jgi:hypothetical protein